MSERVCAACGKTYQLPRYYQLRSMYCSKACRNHGERLTVNKAKSTPVPVVAGNWPAQKPIPVMTADERANLERLLTDERKRLLAAGRALVDTGWRDRRATVRKDER